VADLYRDSIARANARLLTNDHRSRSALLINEPASRPLEEVHVDLVRGAVVAGHGGSIDEEKEKMSIGV
jgi:hypothetical protein